MIRVDRRLHAELHYHILAHLNLGQDAANLYDPGRSAGWVDELTTLYQAAEGRLALQWLPLITPDLPGLLGALDHHEIKSLDHQNGHALMARMAQITRALMITAGPRFRAVAKERRARTQVVMTAIHDPLTRWREALWGILDRAPPPLKILDVIALGRHGRAANRAGEKVIATSLHMPPNHVLCQVFHEDVHGVSDRFNDTAERDTRLESDGFKAHRQLEDAAVELGRRVIQAVDPSRLSIYKAWEKTQGVGLNETTKGSQISL